ncbi:3736_t:CDS:2, partial [Entrophospora sp. SA101]
PNNYYNNEKMKTKYGDSEIDDEDGNQTVKIKGAAKGVKTKAQELL